MIAFRLYGLDFFIDNYSQAEKFLKYFVFEKSIKGTKRMNRMNNNNDTRKKIERTGKEKRGKKIWRHDFKTKTIRSYLSSYIQTHHTRQHLMCVHMLHAHKRSLARIYHVCIAFISLFSFSHKFSKCVKFLRYVCNTH